MQIGALSQLDLLKLLASAYENGKRGAQQGIRDMIKDLEDEILTEKDTLRVHELVAEEAREAMVKSFRARNALSKVDSYSRPGRLSGRLEKALRNPRSVVGTSRSIRILDLEFMDREAAHWRRLNFGVKGTKRGGRVPEMFTIKFDNVGVKGNFGSRAQSRPNFRVPEFKGGTRMVGYFNPAGELHIGRVPGVGRNEGASDGYRKVAGRWSGGVEPWNFADAAFKTVAEDLWLGYRNAIFLANRRASNKRRRRY